MMTAEQGLHTVKLWCLAHSVTEQKRVEYSTAMSVEAEHIGALAKWLVPDDAKPGELFHLAVGDAFLEVEVFEDEVENLSYGVRWRNGQPPSPETFDVDFEILKPHQKGSRA